MTVALSSLKCTRRDLSFLAFITSLECSLKTTLSAFAAPASLICSGSTSPSSSAPTEASASASEIGGFISPRELTVVSSVLRRAMVFSSSLRVGQRRRLWPFLRQWVQPCTIAILRECHRHGHGSGLRSPRNRHVERRTKRTQPKPLKWVGHERGYSCHDAQVAVGHGEVGLRRQKRIIGGAWVEARHRRRRWIVEQRFARPWRGCRDDSLVGVVVVGRHER